MLAALAERRAEGRSLTPKAVEREDPGLHEATVRRFGTIGEAVREIEGAVAGASERDGANRRGEPAGR